MRSLPATNTNALSEGTYDANGNPLLLGGATYTWDAENRMVSRKLSGAESRFTYDGLSRLVRIVELQGSAVVSDKAYLWCGLERCQERDNLQSGAPVTKRYFEQGVVQGGEALYYGKDALGSVRQAVDANAIVRARYDYDAYGNRTKTSGDLDVDMGYAGLFKHKASGLDLAVYRSYDSQRGRWMNRDPIGERGGPTLYSYVNGNPLSYIDPLGLYGFSEFRDDVLYATGGCSGNSFTDDVVNNFVDVQDQTSLGKTAMSLGLGGAFAKQYGGLTALGAAADALRDSQAGFAITGIGSRTFAQAAATAGATWAINGILIKGTFDSGALAGSALRAGVNRLASTSCNCQR